MQSANYTIIPWLIHRIIHTNQCREDMVKGELSDNLERLLDHFRLVVAQGWEFGLLHRALDRRVSREPPKVILRGPLPRQLSLAGRRLRRNLRFGRT